MDVLLGLVLYGRGRNGTAFLGGLSPHYMPCWNLMTDSFAIQGLGFVAVTSTFRISAHHSIPSPADVYLGTYIASVTEQVYIL